MVLPNAPLGSTPLPSPALAYQCPGETYGIEKAIHLGRLARAYPQCRHCVHRFDPDAVQSGIGAFFDEDQDGDTPPTIFSGEGAGGIFPNQFGRDEVTRLATAFGGLLRQDRVGEKAPAIAIASDGRPMTAELLAAASEGLRMMGCEVIDIGFATAPCLAFAINHLNAAGGMLLGDRYGMPQHVAVSFWAEHARPLRMPGTLDRLRSIYDSHIDRPVRCFGSTRRFRAETPYLDGLRQYFHALRPLRVVLQSASVPIGQYVAELTASVACEFICLGREAGSQRSDANGPESDTRLQDRVVSERAHFGVWVDGDGRACRVCDERGHIVDRFEIAEVLFGELLRSRPESTFIVTDGFPSDAENRLSQRGAVVRRCADSAESALDAFEKQGAIAGFVDEGDLYFADPHPIADALEVLTLLLTILSRGDCDLSQVVAAASSV